MQVETTERKCLQDRLWQDQSVGDDDGGIRMMRSHRGCGFVTLKGLRRENGEYKPFGFARDR